MQFYTNVYKYIYILVIFCFIFIYQTSEALKRLKRACCSWSHGLPEAAPGLGGGPPRRGAAPRPLGLQAHGAALRGESEPLGSLTSSQVLLLYIYVYIYTNTYIYIHICIWSYIYCVYMYDLVYRSVCVRHPARERLPSSWQQGLRPGPLVPLRHPAAQGVGAGAFRGSSGGGHRKALGR